MAKKQTLEQVTASIARWQTRLRRAMRMIEKLERQQKRLLKVKPQRLPTEAPFTEAVPRPPVTRPEPVQQTAPVQTPASVKPAAPVNDEIPAFLRRQSPDPMGEQIRAEIEAKKTAKARGRIATMKAKQSGETKKMPLTGKAALAAIRG